jgi:hypothetical protein
MIKTLLPVDRPWGNYPVGTKAHACIGGYWTRVGNGWRAQGGNVFPAPGGDACGNCIELPYPNETHCLKCGKQASAIDHNGGNIEGIGHEEETKYRCKTCGKEWWS